MDAKAKKALLKTIDKNIQLYQNCLENIKNKDQFSDEIENMGAAIALLSMFKADLKSKNADLQDAVKKEVEAFEAVYSEISLITDFFKSYVQDAYERTNPRSNPQLTRHLIKTKELLNQLFDHAMPRTPQIQSDKPFENWSTLNNTYIQNEDKKIKALISKVNLLLHNGNLYLTKWKKEIKKILNGVKPFNPTQSYGNASQETQKLNHKIEALVQKMASKGDLLAINLVREKFPDPLTLKFANLAKSGAVVPKQLPSNQPKLSEKSPSPFLPSHKEPIRLGTIPEEPELENKTHQEFLKQLESAINTFENIYTNVYSKFSLVDKDELSSFFELLKHSVKINPDKTIEEIHLNVLGVLQEKEKEIEGLPKFPSLSEQARENGYTEKTYGMVIDLYSSCFKPVLDRTKQELDRQEKERQDRSRSLKKQLKP
jgi:hypothetical protein